MACKRGCAPQVAAVLDLLVRRPGEVVTRGELRDALWPDTTVEFDQGLNFCIRQLRMALSDDAAQPKYIETLPKRGYRFVGRVGVEGIGTLCSFSYLWLMGCESMATWYPGWSGQATRAWTSRYSLTTVVVPSTAMLCS